MRRRNWQAYASPDAPGVIPRETLALHAFAHGNTCLAAGQFDEALPPFTKLESLSRDIPMSLVGLPKWNGSNRRRARNARRHNRQPPPACHR